jgi:hypothetical protein
MAYSKVQFKSSGDKASFLYHFGYENYQTNVYLYGLCYKFHLNILINLSSFMGTPNSVRILYTASLLTES